VTAANTLSPQRGPARRRPDAGGVHPSLMAGDKPAASGNATGQFADTLPVGPTVNSTSI